MRKNFQNIGFYPQPVLVIGTYDENGTPDAMNVGWGGLVGSVYVELNISEGHKTTANLRKKGAFTVSFADQAHLVEADYVGLVSGNTTPDKIARAGLHPLKSEFVDAPLFAEFPLTLECEVAEITDGPGGLRVIGRVVNMSADESILGEDGLVDADKANFLAYDRVRRVYRLLGGVVGRRINKRIDAKAVRKLLVGLILVIIFICCYNTWQYCH